MLRRLYQSLFLIWICLLPAPALAQVACELARGVSGEVVEVVDGDTVRLAGGMQVRLVGTQAPKLPLGRPDFEPWPLGEDSKSALSALVLNERVTLYHGGQTPDRHGRALAHVFLGDDNQGLWIQGEMVRLGWARTYSFRDNRSCVRELQALEASAREAGRGIWADPFYQIRAAQPPAGLLDLIDTFQLVEGRVVSVQAVNRRVYLNFGQFWREDFTGSISASHARGFEAGGINLTSLEGKTVRIRGWLEERGGPMITITHPEQIEIVEAVSGGN